MIDDEDDREKWVRITLRLPDDLHAKLVATTESLSLNASIVQRLKASVADESKADGLQRVLSIMMAAGLDSQEAFVKAQREKDPSWKKGFEEGRHLGIAETKHLIRETVQEAVLEALARSRPTRKKAHS